MYAHEALTCARLMARHNRGTPQSCQWGELTLFLPFPAWLDAREAPWTCRHARHEQPLKDTESCVNCQDWESRRPEF